MTAARKIALRLTARAGLGIARHRVVRARSLRWAVRVPLVTMAVVSAMVVAAMVTAAPADRSRR